MGKSFNVFRVATPSFESAENQELLENVALSKKLLGDQLDFGWALPSAFRALANPLAPVSLPRKPDSRKDISGAIAYWHSLQWLLIYRLGWANPGKGMSELYFYLSMPHAELDVLKQIGQMDDTLILIRDVWFEDGYLENYITWSRGVNQSYLSKSTDELTSSIYSISDEESSVFLSRSPAGLHLEPQGWHYFLRNEHETVATYSVVTNEQRNKATVIIDNAWGWYDALCDVGVTMQLDELSVYVKSIGFMGDYRFSEQTGLWFTGSHYVHLMGN